MSTPSNRQPDWLALVAVVVTVVVHLTVMSLTGRPNAFFIAGACLFWACYVIVRARQDPGILHDWGFRTDNLRPAACITGLTFAVITVGLAAYGAWTNTLQVPLHLPLLLLVYPAWGVIQQFLALAIVVGNFQRLPGLSEHPFVIVVLGAALFGAVHLYDVHLALGTFALELVVIPLYLAFRNLWPLGVLHGWVGALFYLWVLNQDLWAQTFYTAPSH